MRSGTRRWQQGVLVAALAGISQPALASVTVTFQDGVSPPGYSGTRDVTLNEGTSITWDANTNYDALGYVEVEGYPAPELGLMRWDLQAIPPGSTVTAASLLLNITNASTANYSVYQCLKPWVETEATWNLYRLGSPWTTPGTGTSTTSPDRGSVVLNLDPLTGSTRQATFRLNAAGVQVIQGWVNAPASNDGFVVLGANSTDGLGWSDSEVASANQRPALQVTYSSPDGGVTTLKLQDGATVNGSVYSGAAETIIATSPRTLNQNTGTFYLDGSPDRICALISFDLSAIPPWATVHSASLRFWVTNSSVDSYSMYEALPSWVETEATWDFLSTGVPWSSPGATGPLDHGTVVVGTLSAPATGSVETVLNDAGIQLVQDWIQGTRPNHGFLIQDFSKTDGIDISSRNNTTASERPALVISYTEGQLVLSPAPPVALGQPSAPLTVERQRLDGGAIGAGAPALDVTVTSNSALGELAPAPTGAWSSALVIRIAPDASVSPPFFFRAPVEGLVTLVADAGQVWVPGSVVLTVVDAGPPDAGPPDAGGSPDEDGGTVGPGPDLQVGCGCSGTGASWVPLLALALFGVGRVLARRR